MKVVVCLTWRNTPEGTRHKGRDLRGFLISEDIVKNLKSLLMIGFSVTAMLGAACATAGRNGPPDKADDLTAAWPVTISGCVREGTTRGTFMLMNVTEIKPFGRQQAVPQDSQGRDVLYLLSSNEGLKKRVGERVEVTGTLDLRNVDQARSKVTSDPTQVIASVIEIRTGGETVTVETNTQPQAEAGGVDTLTQTKRVLYRLKVASLRSVPESCQQKRVMMVAPGV